MTAGAFMRAFLFTAAIAACGACGPDPNSPLPLVAPSPFITQLGGQWGGRADLVNVEGLFQSSPGCLGDDVRARLVAQLLPTDPVAIAFTQTGTQITARYTSGGTGLSCTLTGTAALTTVVMDSRNIINECHGPSLSVRCEQAPSVELSLRGFTILGTVVGNTIRGTVTNNYNQTEGDADGSFIVKYDFAVNRQ
jgi:hypothetical protein